jgi:dTDP-4-amino-4,6-dideoxygalactose transaminase
MVYRIPLFDLNFDEDEGRAVLETLRSKWISSGPRVTEFESRFASLLNVTHAIALSNCTAALHLSMELLGIKEGDEVICPSLTFVATVNAIRYVKAIPVFADITSTDDLNISPRQVEALISHRTKAIVVMHYAGFPCDMAGITRIARQHKLKVIEDACHGPLSEYENSKLGTIGDVGCFSFFSNKNISTGEGGMLVTKNDEYAARARLLRSHGMTSLSYDRATGHSTAYDVVEIGYNYRMDDIRASIGLAQLSKLSKDIERRARLRERYLERLVLVDGITIPFRDHKGIVSNYIFPIVLRDSDAAKRERIRHSLRIGGIQTSVHYPAVHRFSAYYDSAQKLPVTDYVTDCEITLPLYSNLSISEIDFISGTLQHALDEH